MTVATSHSVWAAVLSQPVERTCEPELMEDGAQAVAYAAADFGAGDQAVVERVVDLCGPGPIACVVDLGCGPGNISFPLAERFPEAHVVGIDGSAAMLQIARARLAADLSRWPRLAFVQAVLTTDGLSSGGLPRSTALVSNSLLHHLHDPQVLWHGLRLLAAPGAVVYVKDLRRPASPEAAQALCRRHAAGAPAVLQHDYLASLHAAFTVAEVHQQLRQAGLADQLRVAEVDDRYLEVWGRLL